MTLALFSASAASMPGTEIQNQVPAVTTSQIHRPRDMRGFCTRHV